MALRECPDCLRKISTTAPTCPGCGRAMVPVAPPDPGMGMSIWIATALAVSGCITPIATGTIGVFPVPTRTLLDGGDGFFGLVLAALLVVARKQRRPIWLGIGGLIFLCYGVYLFGQVSDAIATIEVSDGVTHGWASIGLMMAGLAYWVTGARVESRATAPSTKATRATTEQESQTP